MFWPIKRITSSSNTARRRPSGASKLLALEPLESRHMLSVVNIMLAGSNMTLSGDGAGDNISVQSVPGNAGSYTITGNSGTLLELNSSGQTLSQPITVNGVNGNITVDLGNGTNQFTFGDPTGNSQSAVLGNLTIENSVGSNTDLLSDLQVNGDLTVTPVGGAAGTTTLTIQTNSQVNGDTHITNRGSSNTTISNSTFQGFTVIDDLTGDNQAITIQGSSTFGSGLLQLQPPVVPPTVLTINVNTGGPPGTGNVTTIFNNIGAASPVIDGRLEIHQGSVRQGLVNSELFSNVLVLGQVDITNGDGTSIVQASGSQFGAMTSVGLPASSIENGRGQATFQMTSSSVPWGLNVDNTNNGASTFGGVVQITGSTIGAMLSANTDSLDITGDNGNNNVTIGPTTGANPVNTTVTGKIDLNLGVGGSGNNTVTLDSAIMSGLNVQTGAGSDSLALKGITVMNTFTGNLGGGVDTVRMVKGSNGQEDTLPTLPLGIIDVNGGLGANTLFFDSADSKYLFGFKNFIDTLLP